ncbi:MAG: deoxyadenosine kinase [Elusimicrobia bacterium RIFOXYB2_FULL_49_7]|nr:MAG: deoxyadenosine kinase [Elusimicrobia bacterium RIFOXYB2_FULL_49_7]
MKNIHHLAVEGNIGVGKTSFCQILSSRLNAQLVLEEHETNPFLKDFYGDRERYAFQTQMFYLLARYRQQSEIAQKDLFHQLVVSDYIFSKDRIFANLTLSDQELTLYEKVADVLEKSLLKPDFVIYLQATTERLFKNIRERNRDYETGLDIDYLNLLNESYNHFFFNYTEAPILIVDATEIDFIHNPNDLDEILRELDRGGKGTRFFKPLSH